MIKIIALVIVVLVVAVLIYAATKPDTFRVQRATRINAPPEKIFALINDYHRWGSWSPYEKLDPDMKRTYSGAANGTGAVYEWEGNSKAGKGRMEIADSVPPSQVAIKLDFVKPFKAHNRVDFSLEPRGNATTVTWAMEGPMPFISKIICLFVDMDRMVGQDFEAGLANIKSIAEK